MGRLLCTIVLVLICGCAPSSISKLRENPGGKDVFVVNQPSSEVYRKILTNARDQYGNAIVGDYFQESREGRISFIPWLSDQLLTGRKSVYFTIDINPVDESRSKVTAYYAKWGGKVYASKVQQWCNSPTP